VPEVAAGAEDHVAAAGDDIEPVDQVIKERRSEVHQEMMATSLITKISTDHQERWHEEETCH